jgi:zinc protease
MSRRLCAPLLALLAGVVSIAGAQSPTPVPRPTKFDYTMTTLPNGLQVVFLEDHSTPIVHLAMWYHVGSKDEPLGRTGFAHLFEHLMFKGSRNVRPDAHPSLITSIGGESNAETDEDTTVYWETVPAHYLPLALWLEADRMASLEVSEEKLKTEIEVVKEERRMKVENQPFGQLSELIFDRAFTTHPYKHPTIGSLRDLEAASLAQVRDFHATYYVPNNATAVIVGDFDTKQAMQLVEKFLGRVPKGKPVPRNIPAETSE